MYVQFSLFQLHNHLTEPVDIFCETEVLHKYCGDSLGLTVNETNEYTLLGTVPAAGTYDIPLFVAYHCKLFVAPSGLG